MRLLGEIPGSGTQSRALFSTGSETGPYLVLLPRRAPIWLLACDSRHTSMGSFSETALFSSSDTPREIVDTPTKAPPAFIYKRRLRSAPLPSCGVCRNSKCTKHPTRTHTPAPHNHPTYPHPPPTTSVPHEIPTYTSTYKQNGEGHHDP